MDNSLVLRKWERVRAKLRGQIYDDVYSACIAPMRFGGLNGNVVTLTLPNQFLCCWARDHLVDWLLVFWREEMPVVRRVEIEAGAEVE